MPAVNRMGRLGAERANYPPTQRFPRQAVRHRSFREVRDSLADPTSTEGLLPAARQRAPARPTPSPSTSDHRGPGNSRLLGVCVPLLPVVTQLRVYRRHSSVVSDRILAILKFSDRKAELQPRVYTPRTLPFVTVTLLPLA
jgi:hypothetical protein